MTEPLQIAVLISALLVGINLSIKAVSIFLFTSKNQRKVLRQLNVKLVLLESLLLFLVMLAAINLVLTNNISYNSMAGILVAVVIASVVPTYAFMVEPMLAFKATGENEIATDRYRHFKFISKEKIRVIDSDLPILNAYATGVIPYTKTIIIGKDIRASLRPDELEAIVYHEVGHLKKNHLLKLYLVNLAVVTLGVVCFTYLKEHIDSSAVPPLWVGIHASFFAGILLFFSSLVQRRFEKEADAFSAQQTNSHAIIKALRRMDELSEGKVSKKSLNYPTLQEREKHIQEKFPLAVV